MSKDVLMAIASALLGALVGYLIGSLVPTDPFSWVIVCSIGVAAAATLGLAGPLRDVLRSPRSTKLAGEWIQEWGYEKDGETVLVKERLLVTQVGSHLSGSTTSLEVAGPFPMRGTTAVFSGTVVQEGVIEGTWRSTLEGRNYRGLFAGVVARSGQEVTLQWLGLENTGIRKAEGRWTRT